MYAGDAMRAAAATQPVARRPFAAPAVLAVAQVGETAPPDAMLEKLRGERGLFRRVASIPAVGGDEQRYHVYRNGYAEQQDVARQQVDALRALAAATDADYLLLVGGTVDQSTGSTPLSVLNLTIVGMFLVPSEHTTAVMKASGAVIDVKTGQVVTLESAELKRNTLATYAGSDADVVRLLDRMRNEITRDLAGRVIDACRAAVEPAATARR